MICHDFENFPQVARFRDSAPRRLAAVTDSNNKVADSTAVRLYSTWPLPANYGFENMVDKIDAPPKKYVFSKRTYEDTIDELCFADLSDMSEFSEEQKKWIPSTHEMKVYTLPSLGRQKAVEDFFIALKQNLKRNTPLSALKYIREVNTGLIDKRPYPSNDTVYKTIMILTYTSIVAMMANLAPLVC